MIKKGFAVFAALLLMSSNLNAFQADCNALAISVADAYAEEGYTAYESWQAGNWAYEGCVSNGGNPGDSIVQL